jgi:hypothetical protein
MKNKLFFATTLVACVALVVAPALAAERTNDRSADRVQRDTERTLTHNDPVRDSRNDQVLAEPRPVFDPSTDADLNIYRGSQLLAQASRLRENGDDNEALRVLSGFAGLAIGDSADADALRTKVYTAMATLYDGAPAKQVAHLNSALRYAADANTQQFLRDRIVSLGGVVLTNETFVSSGASASPTVRSTDDAGDDTCETALQAVLPVEVTSISFPGDVNWRYVVVDEPKDFMFIETIATPNTVNADTSMWLYLGPCPGLLINFDEDGGEGFMSFILQTPVQAATYYVEVRGWCSENVGMDYCENPANEAQVGEYALSITFPDLPTELPPDNYEPDDVREMANKIGHPTSTPLHANSWGRAKRDIQSHTISNEDDEDWMELALQTPQVVQFGTKDTWPTFFNDFTDIPLSIQGRPNGRSGFSQTIHYGVEPCADVTSDMCEPCAAAECDPCCFVNGNSYQDTVSYGRPQPAALVQDEWFGYTTEAEYTVCLAGTMHGNTSLSQVDGVPWYALVLGGGNPTDVFEYEYRASPVVGCKTEVEPNGSILTPNALTVGESMWGVYEFGSTIPFADSDWYAFDVDETVILVIDTQAPSFTASDTYLELFVGPLGEPFEPDTYLPTGLTDDNGGTIWMARLEIPGLPPAADLLNAAGLPPAPDTDYRLRVRSRFAIPNFPYELITEATPLPVPEVEPNDFSEAGSNWMSINPGQAIDAEVIQACDLDTYRISLVESTYVKIETAAGTLSDTVVEMVDCQDGAVIANICNDDGGAGLASRLDGCLGVGDHCFRVRGFNGSATGTYEFNATVIGTGCPSMDPPSMVSSGSNLGCSNNECL